MNKSLYLDYDQEALDRAFDQRAWAANASEVLERYKLAGKIIRDDARLRANLIYGSGQNEQLDVYLTDSPSAPIHMHLHGGAWRWLSKEDVAFAAPTVVAGGMHYIVPDFTALPEASLPQVVDQLCRAIAWVHANAPSFGGDPNRIYVSGHSSGAHLCAVLLTLDMTLYGLPANVIKGALCISGIYDMEPVLLSARGSYVNLAPEQLMSMSPLLCVDSIGCPVTVAHAEHDNPEFIRQSRSFHAALSAKGRTTELVAISGVNHFEVAEWIASLAYRCKAFAHASAAANRVKVVRS